MIYHLYYSVSIDKCVYTDILDDEDDRNWKYLSFRNDATMALSGWNVDPENHSAATARDLCQCYEIQMWEAV